MPDTEQAVEIDEQKLEAFMNKAVGELGATLGAGAGGDRRPARPLEGNGGRRRAHVRGARRAHRHRGALRARVAERPGRRWLRHLRPGDRRPSRFRRSRRSRWPTRPARSSCCGAFQGFTRWFATNRRSARHSRRARASAGTSTVTICSKAPSASSARATTHTSWPHGSRRSTASRPSSGSAVASPTSAAASARRRSSWRRPSRTRSSSASTITPSPSKPLAREQMPRASPIACASRWRRQRGSRARTTSSRSSTACTTWAIRSAQRATCSARSTRDGTWLIVEPFAGDKVEDNLNPVGRAYYGASTLVCTPASLSQEVGLALGAQAGEARLREVVTAGGFTRFRRATETPFNLVLEARP